VFATSGTTGVPKSVVVTHGSLAAVAAQSAAAWALTPADVVGALAPIGVDFAVLELAAAWGAGACSRVLPRTDGVDPAAIRARLEGVTVLHAVPRVLEAVLGQPPGPPASLRYLSTGGDLVPAAVLTAMARVPGCAVEVNYGPTETTVICAAAPVRTPATGMLGRPLPGTVLATVPRIQRCFFNFWVSSNSASVAMPLASSGREIFS
jgi:non-ribosomal peptide synthetase component F